MIRFNADTSSSLTWDFKPQQSELKVYSLSLLLVKIFRKTIAFSYRLLLEKQLWLSTLPQTGLLDPSMESAPTMLCPLRLGSISTRFNVFVLRNSVSTQMNRLGFFCLNNLYSHTITYTPIFDIRSTCQSFSISTPISVKTREWKISNRSRCRIRSLKPRKGQP